MPLSRPRGSFYNKPHCSRARQRWRPFGRFDNPSPRPPPRSGEGEKARCPPSEAERGAGGRGVERPAPGLHARLVPEFLVSRQEKQIMRKSRWAALAAVAFGSVVFLAASNPAAPEPSKKVGPDR